MTLYPVILVGGGGTRLWPLSRRERPKPFLELGGRTLLAQALERAAALAPAERIYAVTLAEYAPLVREAAPSLSGARLILEPGARDTAAAIALAATVLAARDPEALLLVLPADHLVEPVAAFARVARAAAALAAEGWLVTLGLPPRTPATAYGYIERASPLDVPAGAAEPGAPAAPAPRAFRVAGFREKPDRVMAARYQAGGEHYWNLGVFAWSARRFLEVLAEVAPEHAAAFARVGAALGGRKAEQTLAEVYAGLRKISVDYAVMEPAARAGRVAVVEADFAWDDIGSWTALGEHLPRDAAGNAVQGNFLGLDARDCVVVGEPGQLIAAIGVQGLIIVQTPRAVFIAPRERDQEVRRLVERLGADGAVKSQE